MSKVQIDFDPNRTLGFLAADWVEAHCKVPTGVFRGEGLVFDGWQLETVLNHYRVNADAAYDRRDVISPFFYRRSAIVGPQKCGKSPWGAALVLFEGVGPCLFAGWAEGGETYRCADNHCTCGWEYDYQPGEAMGMVRETSLIAILAVAEQQTDNIYLPLKSMINSGPLSEFVKVREGFIRLPNDGLIMPMTAEASSKLGQPLNFAIADESGLYTARNKVRKTWETIRRGVAGMQGRTIELTNPWDPMENSSAQVCFESKQKDIYRYYRKPPAELSYTNKADRHKIHKFVYADSPWVSLKAIDAEAAELMETDPVQAERFFGNRLVQGKGSFIPDTLWVKQTVRERVPAGALVCGGFDGSRSGDWTAIRLETVDGVRFTPTYGPDKRPTVWKPDEWPNGRIPRGEVDAAVSEIFARYKVGRFYVDPRHWETQCDVWEQNYGEDVVLQWPTNQVKRMFGALTRYLEDLTEGLTSHVDDVDATTCAFNARRVAKSGDMFILGKPSENQKIDVLMADILAHEAAADMRAAGWSPSGKGKTGRMIMFAD